MRCDVCGAEEAEASPYDASGMLLCPKCMETYGNAHPGFMSRVGSFVVSHVEWAAAGFPMRDPDEVREIWRDHCSTCPKYDPELKVPPIMPIRTGGCTVCTCHVSDNPRDKGNKITRPNASCPLKPPKWSRIVEAEPEADS